MIPLARWISIVAHPFVTAGILVVAVGAKLGPPGEALRTLGLVALIALAPVALLMARQVRKGAWENVDASNRAERPLLFGVGLGALLALLAVAVVLRPGAFLVRGTLGVGAMLAACAVATRWIKVSLHSAFAALSAVVLLLLGSRVGWPLLAALPAIAWSRLALGRHSGAEVAAGLGAGALAGLLIVAV